MTWNLYQKFVYTTLRTILFSTFGGWLLMFALPLVGGPAIGYWTAVLATFLLRGVFSGLVVTAYPPPLSLGVKGGWWRS